MDTLVRSAHRSPKEQCASATAFPGATSGRCFVRSRLHVADPEKTCNKYYDRQKNTMRWRGLGGATMVFSRTMFKIEKNNFLCRSVPPTTNPRPTPSPPSPPNQQLYWLHVCVPHCLIQIQHRWISKNKCLLLECGRQMRNIRTYFVSGSTDVFREHWGLL